MFPSQPTSRLQKESPITELRTTSIELGGYFYDHFVNADGLLSGVRYWVAPNTNFHAHPVFSQFLQDKRFVFDSLHGFVDVFFEASGGPDFRRGDLCIETVQDFGGDCVVRKFEALGICFEIGD